jgi:cyclophilin family peptidyl-prolyl cis-trans isomerase
MKKVFLGIGIGVVVAGLVFLVKPNDLLTSLIRTPHPNVVTLQTNKGNIKIKLFREEAPKITENFYQLARNGNYDSTIFHRIIKGFMIQGGDYENSDGTGGEAFEGGMLPDEISPKLSHVRGAVSMANRGPATNGSQFFIVHKDAKFLDGKHSIFGQVISNMAVIDRISRVHTDLKDRPIEPVVIESVSFE